MLSKTLSHLEYMVLTPSKTQASTSSIPNKDPLAINAIKIYMDTILNKNEGNI